MKKCAAILAGAAALVIAFSSPAHAVDDVSITDPVGDWQFEQVDAVSFGISTTSTRVRVTFTLSDETLIQPFITSGVLFDTDQNPATGFPAADAGFPAHNIGADYYTVTPTLGLQGPVAELYRYDGTEVKVGEVPITISGKTVTYTFRQSQFANQAVTMNVAAFVGSFNGATDFMPNSGSITVN